MELKQVHHTHPQEVLVAVAMVLTVGIIKVLLRLVVPILEVVLEVFVCGEEITVWLADLE